MRSANTDRAKPGVSGNGSKWRSTYKVHPAADVFPMMEGAEMDALVADIKAHGLKNEIRFDRNGVLIDGRNRLAAMELARIELRPCDKITALGDPVAEIIALNIHRRHLTKQQQADLIVAAIKAGEASRQVGEVSKGGRGKVDQAKAKAVEIAKAEGIGKRTVERSFAKAAGRKPAALAARSQPKPISSLTQARREYLKCCSNPGVDLGAEMQIVVDGLQEIIDRRGGNGAAE